MKRIIHHNGIIERIEDDVVYVRIVQQSACSDCHAHSVCPTSESKVKIIEVPDKSRKFHIHEEVAICGQNSMGLKAVLFAFVFPLLLVVFTIVICLQYGLNESTSGLISLLVLVPYYLALYFLRDSLKSQFIFTIRKLDYSL